MSQSEYSSLLHPLPELQFNSNMITIRKLSSIALVHNYPPTKNTVSQTFLDCDRCIFSPITSTPQREISTPTLISIFWDPLVSLNEHSLHHFNTTHDVCSVEDVYTLLGVVLQADLSSR